MNRSAKNNEFIKQAVTVFSYFDLILHQLKTSSKESFLHSLFILKKITENLRFKNSETNAGDLITKDLELNKVRLSELTVLLQFEDILDQKFDHISIINQMVIKELRNNDQLSPESKSLLLKKTILLNSAQLEHIKEEHKNICRDMKDKLEDIYKASANILSIFEKVKKGEDHPVNFSIMKLNSSMNLIRSFVDTDIIQFAHKIDTLIKIYDGLNINIFFSERKQIDGFDLSKLLKVYTMESERKVFVEVLGDIDGIELRKINVEQDDDSVHLF